MRNFFLSNEKYSPSTQAVSDAAEQVYWDWGNMSPASADTIAAAALRAAADKINFKDELGLTAYGGHSRAKQQLLEIADELSQN